MTASDISKTSAAQRRTLAGWLLFCFVWGVLLISFSGAFFPRMVSFNDFATHDFIQYWAAFRLFAAAGDPYNPHSMLTVQQAAGWPDPKLPLMMWNPPWILLIMLPALNWPLIISAQLWFILSLMLLGLSWYLLERAFIRPGISPAPLRLGFCLFLFPLQQALEYGQCSVLLVAGLSLLAFGLSRKSDAAAALGFLLISVKPHLVAAAAILAAVQLYRQRRSGAAVLTILTFTAAAALPAMIAPNIWSGWLADPLTKAGSGEVVPTAVWKSATLVSYLIYEYLPFELSTLSLLRTAIPLGLAVLYLYWLLRSSRLQFRSRTFGRAVTLSLLFAPYGWIMDQSILMIPQFLLFQELDGARRGWRLLGSAAPIVVLNIAAGWYGKTQIQYHHEMFWLPAAFFILFEIYYRWILPHTGSDPAAAQ